MGLFEDLRDPDEAVEEDELESLFEIRRVEAPNLSLEGRLQDNTDENIEEDQGFVDGILSDLNDIKEDPVRGLPFALETGGAILGGLGTGGLGAPVGALLGRFTGEIIESVARDTDLLTQENVYETLAAPIFSIPFSVPAGIARSLIKGADDALGRTARVITKPFRVPENTAEILAEATSKTLHQRQAAFLDEPLALVDKLNPTIDALRRMVDKDADTLISTAVRELNQPKTHGGGFIDALTDQAVPEKTLDDLLSADPALKGLRDDLLKAEGPRKPGGQVKARTVLARLEEAAKGKLDTASRMLEETKALEVAENLIPQSVNDNYIKSKGLIMMGQDNVPAGELIREGKQLGFGAKMFGVQRELRKFNNPHATLVADVLHHSDNYQQSISDFIKGQHRPILKKYGLDKGSAAFEDHMLLNVFQQKPDIAKKVLDGTITNIEGFDPQRVKQLANFTKEMVETERDPAMALLRRGQVNPVDPKKRIGTLSDEPVKRELFSSTSVGTRNAQQEADDLNRFLKEYNALSPEDKAGEFGELLRGQLHAMTARNTVAKDAGDKVSRAVLDAAEYTEKTGHISKEVFLGAAKDTNEKLLLGSNIAANYDDYAEGIARKIALDDALPVMLGATKKMGDAKFQKRVLLEDLAAKAQQGDEEAVRLLASPKQIDDLVQKSVDSQRNLRRYAEDAIQARTGQMKAASIHNISNTLKDAPVIGQFVTPERTQNLVADINGAVYMLNIGLNARFAPMNLLQSLTTLLPSVGMPTYARAFWDTVKDFKNIAGRAAQAGTIADVGEELVEQVAGKGRLTKTKMFKATNWLPEKTEKWNRVFAHRAGEIQAEAQGLAGDEVQQFAKGLSKQVNFGTTASERPLITNTAGGGMLFRFKSFVTGYSTMVKHLMETNPQAAADAMVMTAAIGGTGGIPMYDYIREGVAELTGTVLPEVSVIDQMTPLDFGRSTDTTFSFPDRPGELLGPVFAPPIEFILGAARGDEVAMGRAAQQVGGPLLGRLPGAIGQALQGGEVRTPIANKLLGVRSGTDIVKQGLAFKAGVRQDRARLIREMEIGLKAGDMKAVRAARAEAQAKGLRNIRGMLSSAKSNVKQDKETSFLSVFLGV